jgi:hypothetical protein
MRQIKIDNKKRVFINLLSFPLLPLPELVLQLKLNTYHSLHPVVFLSIVISSVADPGCLSRIPDPDFYPSRIPDLASRIPDPKTATKERGEKKLLSYFFCIHKFQKIESYFIFELVIWANFQRIIEVFTQKNFTILSKIWFGIRDPRSGIRKKPIPDPGSRGQKGTGSRIRIRNTGYQPDLVYLLYTVSRWSLRVSLKYN